MTSAWPLHPVRLNQSFSPRLVCLHLPKSWARKQVLIQLSQSEPPFPPPVRLSSYFLATLLGWL